MGMEGSVFVVRVRFFKVLTCSTHTLCMFFYSRASTHAFTDAHKQGLSSGKKKMCIQHHGHMSTFSFTNRFLHSYFDHLTRNRDLLVFSDDINR